MKMNIGQFLTRRAFLSPRLEAMVEPALGGRRISFSELNARCNRVAHALRGSGVKHGDRVALLLMNGAEFIESFLRRRQDRRRQRAAELAAACPTSWSSSSRTRAPPCCCTRTTSRRWWPSCSAAATRPTCVRWVQLGGDTAAFAQRLRGVDRRPTRTEPEVGRRRRRPAVHHVHLGHHRAAQGRDAQPPHGDVGR